MPYFFILLFLGVSFHGCSENYLSQVNSPSILKRDIECLNLIVFPPNIPIETTLHKLYSFEKNCDLDLVVSYKSSIICNSNQNSQKKALGMAKSYLRLELKREQKLLYSYYIDLAQNLEPQDVRDGFEVMKETLHFVKK